MRWEYCHSFLPPPPAFFAGFGGKADLEMQRPVCEDFRQPDLNVNILGVNFSSDISSFRAFDFYCMRCLCIY